jgi:phospholipid/cholesterol/gamma-HCH transport system ATP-binding protein
MPQEPVVEIKDLQKCFGNNRVLNGVDLTVSKGETVIIMGLSGTGKSVLIKHILGLLQPDAGSIRVKGVDLFQAKGPKRAAILRNMGMSFQNAALFDSMSARENVAFPLREHLDLKEDEVTRRVDEALHLVGLTGLGDRYPSELSGGMRKRVGIARGMILNPEIMLFDEPTTGLDPILSDVITRCIARARTALGFTCIVVTHDLKLTFRLGDHVALLHQGRVIFDDTATAFQESSDPAVQQFIAGRSKHGPIEVQ